MTNNITCSILYHPDQDVRSGFMVIENDLEFEGNVYTFGIRSEEQSDLIKRITKAQKEKLPLKQFSFDLTTEQSTRLREILKQKNEPFLKPTNESTKTKVKLFFQKCKEKKPAQVLESRIMNPMIPTSYCCVDFLKSILEYINIKKPTCSILYYPGQDVKFGCIVGHADLEFEGTVYTFARGAQIEFQLNERMAKAQKGGLPFERFTLDLSEEQSLRLREILKSQNKPYFDTLDESRKDLAIFFVQKCFGNRKLRMLEKTIINPMIPTSYSCMDYVSNVLEKAKIIRIPKMIKLSPLLGSLYLRAAKFCGDERIKGITQFGSSFSSLKNCLIVNFCRLGEIGVLALPILGLAYCCA